MAIAAHLESDGATPGKRGAARLMLRFETVGSAQSGRGHPVRVHNASTTGLLLESEGALSVDDPIDIDFPHAGVVSARVVWASGNLYGCRFDRPLSQAALSAAQLRSETGLDLGGAGRPGRAAGESFAARLQRLRKERGLTLSQLGDRLGVSKPTVWAWEKGKARPLDSRIAAIAEALGAAREELADVQDDAEAREVLARSREAIARAYGTEPAKIRIMIEL